jgi:hypothetical protein
VHWNAAGATGFLCRQAGEPRLAPLSSEVKGFFPPSACFICATDIPHRFEASVSLKTNFIWWSLSAKIKKCVCLYCFISVQWLLRHERCYLQNMKEFSGFHKVRSVTFFQIRCVFILFYGRVTKNKSSFLYNPI